MTRILDFLWLLNPLRPWFEQRERLARLAADQAAWERLERQSERELQAKAIESLSEVVKEALKASAAQTGIVQEFLKSFQTSDSPQLREWDEEAWERRAASRAAAGTPVELDGLDSIGQYSALIDKLNSFGLDD